MERAEQFNHQEFWQKFETSKAFSSAAIASVAREHPELGIDPNPIEQAILCRNFSGQAVDVYTRQEVGIPAGTNLSPCQEVPAVEPNNQPYYPQNPNRFEQQQFSQNVGGSQSSTSAPSYENSTNYTTHASNESDASLGGAGWLGLLGIGVAGYVIYEIYKERR